jgi:DTW domain-containing protein YfiP
MTREMCYRCFWPKALCWCDSIQPMETATRFELLMHPKEFKRIKAGTGRLTHLCLSNSEIRVGIGFNGDEVLRALIRDPRYAPVLLYPGPDARNLSKGEPPVDDLAGRQLLILVLDGTWSLARKMLRLSPSLSLLPRVMLTPSAPSRYVIKQQPERWCLSTLEAIHEVLVALERSGLDRYPRPDQLLGLFQRMQELQIRCAADPERKGYRRSPYSDPSERRPPQGRSGLRRTKFLVIPDRAAALEPRRD